MFGLGFGELPQVGQGLGERVKSFRKTFQPARSDGDSDKPPAPPPEK
jgi:Sec-independent protein translocase protein TatA